MTRTFSQAFTERLKETGAKVTEIANKSGVSKEALYSLKYGKSRNMGVEDAIKVARAFGMSVEEFMGLTPSRLQSTLSDHLARLSPAEQQILEATLEAILSQRPTPRSEPSQGEAQD